MAGSSNEEEVAPVFKQLLNLRLAICELPVGLGLEECDLLGCLHLPDIVPHLRQKNLSSLAAHGLKIWLSPKLGHGFLAHLTWWCPRLCIAAQCKATRPPANMGSREWREGVLEVRLASPGPENQEEIKVNQEQIKVNQGKSSSNKH